MNAKTLQMLWHASDHYESHGFNPIDVPWSVEPAFSEMTSVDDAFALRGGNVMVGSAEQAFLQQMIAPASGYPVVLLDKTYQAITPCFRGDTTDELHRTQFMKLELFSASKDVDRLFKILDRVRELAVDLFEEMIVEYAGDHRHLLLTSVLPTGGQSFDINLIRIGREPIELGSYGIRSYHDTHWVYGTGLALPRFADAVSILTGN
jgi:hypothetical protein